MNRIASFGLALVLSLFLGGAASADWREWLRSATENLTESRTGQTALSDEQVIRGLKEALRVGTEKAVELLGREGGYLDDASVRIPLPKGVRSIGDGLRRLGQGALVDEFEETINRAAERAIPQTLSIFGDAIRQMTLDDARGILNGGDTAATEYFRGHSSDRLNGAILPIVRQATDRAGVTSAYKGMVSNVGFLGDYVDMSTLDLDRYVTQKAVQGLFVKLAEEERMIRHDPVARTTDILKTVFGGSGR